MAQAALLSETALQHDGQAEEQSAATATGPGSVKAAEEAGAKTSGGGGGAGTEAADSDPVAPLRVKTKDGGAESGERRMSSLVKSEESKHRAMLAAHWIDKEIRKLIAQIKEHGSVNAKGQHVVSYGRLFEMTFQQFEALSGTLRTARKQQVVHFEGEVLFQGVSDHVQITLLRDTIPDSTIETYTCGQMKEVTKPKQHGKGFSKVSLQNSKAKCCVCSKTVYPMEFVGAADKAFHKACFKCKTCGTRLTATTYCSVNDDFYCQTHYNQNFLEAGDYSKGFAKRPSSSSLNAHSTT